MGVSHCQSRQQHLTITIQYSDKMFIEDEADAVFNEIRNQRKDSDDKEEEITTNDQMSPAVRETKAASPGPAPMITIKVDVLSDSIELEELEEPVSPPACHPSEGPPLLFSSQSIEDLAAVIVKENRGEKEEEKEDIPKSGTTKSVVAAATTSKAVPALIPLTVSEFGGELPASSPSTLHMSGGGVYTTDSYYRNFGPRLTTSTTSSGARVSTPPPPLQPSVIKKLPVSTAAPMPAKKRSVIKSKPALAEDKEKQENILREFYKKSNLITEAQKTIKLSDGLEITPIINVPSLCNNVPTKKRSYESTDNDHNQGSKCARNDLVIEKIPRKNTEKEQTEQSNLQTNEQAFDCKLVISRLNKKVKLVFDNGIEVPISRTILKHIIPPSKPQTTQSTRIRRKTARARKISNGKSESKSQLEKEPKVTKDDKTTGNPESSADMPLIVDSTKVEFPLSSRDTSSKSKLPPAPVGQHKLPCVVSQPSYQRGANRKILAKSK